MKKYNVTVNGTAYEVTLEAVDASEVKASPAPGCCSRRSTCTHSRRYSRRCSRSPCFGW